MQRVLRLLFPSVALLVTTVAISGCDQRDASGHRPDDACAVRADQLVGSCIIGAFSSCVEYRGDIDPIAAEADCVGADWEGNFSTDSCRIFYENGGCVLSRPAGAVVLYQRVGPASCEERDGCSFHDYLCTELDPTATLLGTCTNGASCWEVRGGERPWEDWRRECLERRDSWTWSDEACPEPFQSLGACAIGASGATVLEFTTPEFSPDEAEFWCNSPGTCSEYVRP